MIKKHLFAIIVSCGFMLAAAPCLAVAPQFSMTQEAVQISKELRCPDSINQNLFESELPQAAKMKAEIFQFLKEGKTKEEILKIFADRYGQQIRYSPEMNSSTIALWVLPSLLLVVFVGFGGFLIWKRRR